MTIKIYVSHSTQFDFIKQLYAPLQQSKLNTLYQFYFPHQTSITPENTQAIIKSSAIILAEASFPSTGQGIELGWASFFNLPIICLHHEHTKPSSSLQVITPDVFSYNDTRDMLDKVTMALAKIKF